MIVPRRMAFLVLAAVAALAASASAKSAAKQWTHHLEKLDAKLVEETRAAMRNPALRGSDVVAATDTFQPTMMFGWSKNGCSGNAYIASYLSTQCAVRDEGLSTRYNCVTHVGGVTGEVQYYGFNNTDCSGEPTVVKVVRNFVVGNCGLGNVKVECTAELKYGLEGNSVVSAWYGDSECTNLYGANFQAYGCVDGRKAVCEGGEFIDQEFENNDCTGDFVFDATYPIDTCELDVELTDDDDGADDDDDGADDDDDADDDDFDDDEFTDLTNYVKRSCSSDEFVFPDAPKDDDDDSAYTAGAGLASVVALIAGVASYAFNTMST